MAFVWPASLMIIPCRFVFASFGLGFLVSILAASFMFPVLGYFGLYICNQMFVIMNRVLFLQVVPLQLCWNIA